MRRSSDGLLDTNLNVHFATNRIGDREVFTRTFEGGITAPTLRVRTGDTLRIRLSNFLPPDVEEEHDDINIPHGFNTTNLHTHGFHVSPNCSADGSVCSDNVLIEVHPGETQQYEYYLPENHPDGTFWYHPHKHGSAAVQFMGGMAGALIVEGESDAFLREHGIERDEVFVLQQIRVKEDGEVRVERFEDFLEHPIFTLNGQL
ncbi:MAG: multicopper oxidase domain-containing protein, partial [Candidatus Tectomicrobia bacterium]|nr:multicopper oxidase domain-containing protein [Candidatus Tectomicrobia bacterium]